MKKAQLKVGLLEKIKSDLTKNGKKKSISDRSIKELLNSKLTRFLKKYEDKEDEDEIDEKEFLDAYLDDFVIADNNIRNDIANAIKQKEEDDKNKDPKGKTKKDDTSKKEDKTMSEFEERFSQLEKGFNEMKSKNEQYEQEKLHRAKIEDIKKGLSEAKITDKDFIEMFFEDRNISSETDVDEQVSKAVKMYNKLKSSPSDETYTPYSKNDGSLSEEDKNFNESMRDLIPD